jgi:hypothetical protein
MKTGVSNLPLGLFHRAPETIVEALLSRETFPEGPAAGMRILAFYITHAGKRLSASRLRSLEKARKLLSARLDELLKEESRRAA